MSNRLENKTLDSDDDYDDGGDAEKQISALDRHPRK